MPAEVDKGTLTARELIRWNLSDVAMLLRQTKPIAEQLSDVNLARLPFAIDDALSIVTSMLNTLEYYDEVRRLTTVHTVDRRSVYRFSEDRAALDRLQRAVTDSRRF